jgi:CRP/FNR family cyclic AMP-dependent transcriptional regulator
MSASAVPSSSADIAKLLANVPLFRGLNEPSLERMAEVSRVVAYGRNDVIFREGEIGDALYVVLQGEVRISREVAGMGEEALTILARGEAFGEMSVMNDFPRSADAKAHTATELLAVSRDAFEDLLFLDKDLAYEILWNFVRTLSTRLRETNDKMTFLTISGKY